MEGLSFAGENKNGNASDNPLGDRTENHVCYEPHKAECNDADKSGG
jgi:hypothetical protein